MDKAGFLARLESRIDSQLNRAIEIFQNLDTNAMLRPSSAGGWSIAQCLEHLNSYGDFYLPEIKKALAKKSRASRYKSGWLGNYFAKIMEPGSRQKFKAFKSHRPAPDLDASAVNAEFIRQLEQLLKFIREAKNADLDKRLPISINPFIRLKLGDVLRFIAAHNERHIQQAMRNVPGSSKTRHPELVEGWGLSP